MVDYGTKYDRLYVAIVTPYTDNTYKPDEAQLRSFLQFFLQPKYVEAGIGIIINPEAGEIFYLNREEKRRNVEIAIDEVNGKIPVFAGAIDTSTEGTVEVAVDAKQAGADGVFVIPPMGAIDVTTCWDSTKYSEVWIDMLKALQDGVGDMPFICHPTGSQSIKYGEGLPVEVAVKTCNEIKNVVGWKMTYNYTGFRIISRALRKLDRHVGLLGAPAINFHENLASDRFDGTVSGSWNYSPEPMLDHIVAWRNGNLEEARRIWDSGLAEIHEYVYSEFSRLHIRYKTATWLRGFISNPFMKPPMPKPRKEEVKRLSEVLSNAGLSAIDSEKISSITQSLPL
ncbi:MAG: dihydrodipicolinate synthase family protein [Desulfatiglandales bacterium]|nr:dihydrodipicolinate synthase family protein [Desulfatiglandales bacterium]